jgi:hypothetical protein
LRTPDGWSRRISSVPGRIPNGSQRSSIELLELRGESFEDGAHLIDDLKTAPTSPAAIIDLSFFPKT